MIARSVIKRQPRNQISSAVIEVEIGDEDLEADDEIEMSIDTNILTCWH